MQTSIFEHLEHVRPAARYTKPVVKRIKILEDTVNELRQYHNNKAKGDKKIIIERMIAKREELLARLNSLI